ncbi:hypothetical protein SOPP22_05710 [Shewanella sp. OPT22]|nr:hypothetical protein SOPP22_05710 [Shewanella sp. OPT22]
MFEFGLIALSVLSCILLGSNAYHSGMPVRRWGVAGLVLGPFAYPFLNAHKNIAYRKAVQIGDIKFRS